MKHNSNTLWLIALNLVLLLSLVIPGQCASWPYDPELQPISSEEVVQLVGNVNQDNVTSSHLLNRASVSGLLETVVVECSKQLKQTPRDPILRSLYCYALAIAHDPAEYTPQDKGAWLHQQNLFASAALDAEYVVREEGAKISFCWRALAFANFKGVSSGYVIGTERAEKALQLAPNDPYANRLVAMAYLRQTPNRPSDPNKVLLYGRRAAQLQPKSQKPHFYQAEALFRLKKYSAALAELRNSRSPGIYYRQSSVARKT